MPSFSFKEQFVPFVIDGTKQHTVRNRRKSQCFVGDTCYLFYGLRTRYVQRIGEHPCINTHSIGIDLITGIVFYSRLLNKRELSVAQKHPLFKKLPIQKVLNSEERNQFAWSDGFRPEGSTRQAPGNAYALMLRFWMETHPLPWVGDVIYWDHSK